MISSGRGRPRDLPLDTPYAYVLLHRLRIIRLQCYTKVGKRTSQLQGHESKILWFTRMSLPFTLHSFIQIFYSFAKVIMNTKRKDSFHKFSNTKTTVYASQFGTGHVYTETR